MAFVAIAWAMPAAAQPDADAVRVVRGGEPAFEAIGPRQGLTSSAIYAVTVDRYGFVWFAGDSGLHRFDGQDTRTIDRDPGQSNTLESRTNTALAETTEAMWLLSFSGTLQRLDKQTGALTTVELVRPSDRAQPARGTKLMADAHERLWVGTDIGLFRVTDQEDAQWVALGDNPRVTALAVQPDATQLLVGTVDGRILAVELDDPALVRDAIAPTAGAQRPVPLALAADGQRLWVGTDQGLFVVPSKGAGLSRAGIPAELQRWRLDAVVVARDGTLWLGGTHHLGLTRFEPATGETANYRHHPGDPFSLGDERIAALALDADDNLWIGLQSGGANRLSLAQKGAVRFRGLTSRSNGYCALLPRGPEEVLAALCGAGLARLNPLDSQLESRRRDIDAALATAAPTLTAHALVDDGQGGVWVPTGNMGLLHWEPDAYRATRHPLHRLDGTVLPDVYMNSALRAHDGRLWVATSQGLASMGADRTLVLHRASELEHLDLSGGVLAVAEGPDRALWLGTTRGLVRLDPFSRVSERFAFDAKDPQSLSDNLVVSLAVDADGAVWVGTQAGLNRAEAQGDGRWRFQRFGVHEGLPDQSVDALVLDDHGVLWAGTKRGIARFDAFRERFRAFGPSDGVPDAGVHWRAASNPHDGSLWFGTREGLLRIYPEALGESRPRLVRLGSFEVGGKDLTHLAGPQLPSLRTSHDAARVRFVVSAFGDTRPLEYRLEGLDAAWYDMPSNLTVHYDPLPSGTYRFEVRQLQSSGIWSESLLSIPVQVDAPPWRSPWAIAAYVAIVLGALVMAGLLWQKSMALKLKASEMDRLALQSRLQLLQGQVAPHFLFNTFANIQALVESGSPQAVEVLDALSTYLRSSVPQLDQPVSTIERELELVRAYLDIMAMRMPQRLRFHVNADPDATALMIPPVSILTLVENAVRHGIDPSVKGGSIDVAVTRQGERCVVYVVDTGVGLLSGSGGLGTGLSTLRERLKLHFGEDAKLTISENHASGVTAMMDFPARVTSETAG